MAIAAAISTTNNDDVIVIDGTSYRVANAQALTIAQSAQVRRSAKLFERVQSDELTDEEAAAADHALDSITRMALPDAPQEVLSRLSIMHKMRIVEVFFLALRGDDTPTAENSMTPASQSSPISSAITADESPTG